MRYLRLVLGLALVAWAGGEVRGDDKFAGRAVTVEVVIAEFTSTEKADPVTGFGASDQSAADRLKLLAAQGQLSVVTRARMSTLHQQEASIQVGETAPVVSGRTPRGGGGPGGGGPGGGGFGAGGAGGGFPAATSYTMVNVGTLIRATPQCEEKGDVLVNLTVERSRLAPKPKAEGAAGATDIEPSRTVSVMARSTIRVPASQTVLMSGAKNSTNDQTTELLIIVSAQVGDGVPASAPANTRSSKKSPGDQPSAAGSQEKSIVYPLVQTKVTEAAKTIRELFSKSTLVVAIDQRANALTLRGPAELVNDAAQLLVELDSKPPVAQ